MTLTTELADRLECERVSMGFLRAGRIRLTAVSHSAHFKEPTNLLRAVSDCMEEAVDQGATVAFPPIQGTLPAVSRPHQALAASQDVGAILTILLAGASKVVGAITLERSAQRPFDQEAVELCEAIAGLAGPMLDVHRREDQLMLVRAGWWGRDLLARLVGPRHLGFKLGALIAAAVLAFLILAQGDFRVSATSALEPLVQQAAVAPFNGYIREAPVRTGDVVKAGTLLALLDDRELKLERLKWLGQQEELLKQLRQSMASHDSAQTQVLSAQLEQNRAQLARVEGQLSRTRIVAPFDGVVVSGDLTQQLGAPVEGGTVLFEVAPTASYRLILKVDERDISHIKVGQTGSILLSAFPNAPVRFAVNKITPVSTAKEGRNFFRVQAAFDQADARLRPGMEGVGKIEVDRRSWIWIWTHDIWESIRLYVWKWLP